MNTDTLQIKDSLPPHWREALPHAGFAANGDGLWHYDNITFRRDGRWLLLETTSNPAPPDLLRDLGRPGLWKRVAQGPVGLRIFEFPVEICSEEEAALDDDETNLSPEAFLAWALATAKDGTPPGWQPPPRALVESWLPQGALTVQAGAFVRQGELVLSPERWAVRFPILPVVPVDLPVARREWLRAVLGDAQTLWRLVRLGFAGEGENLAVLAEAEFTGAPSSENLFLAGVNGVRHVVAALAETVEVLGDATIASQALALGPSSNQAAERSET